MKLSCTVIDIGMRVIYNCFDQTKPANKKSSPKADLTEGKFAGSR